MEVPSVDAGSIVYFKYTDHFAGAVEGWSDAEIITAEQRSVIVEIGPLVGNAAMILRNALTSRAEAERAATKLRARFAIRDIVLDKRIMATSDAVLNGPAMRDREHPVFTAVFKDGPAGDITSAKMREEPEVAERMRDRFAATPDFDGKARVQADLDESLAKSVATRDALDDAEVAENKAGDAELLARIGVRTALEQAYGKLRTAFPGQRKLVESFFYRAERQAKKANTNEPSEPAGP
jgi:hypothetical protein